MQQHRMPHALLLAGPEGLGKKHFALTFAHSMLCGQADAPCGQCRACQLLNAGSHPNLVLIEPEEAGQAIKVDAIRAAIQFANDTALQDGYKIIIIHPAAAMNMNAANALLKTLEEPAKNTLFILVSHQPARLPLTVQSRCQKILFSIPPAVVALAWLHTQIHHPEDELRLFLHLAGGAPLKALVWANDDMLQARKTLYQGLHAICLRQAGHLPLAAGLQEQNIIFLLNLMLLWVRDLLRLQFTQDSCELVNVDYRDQFMQVNAVMAKEKLLGFLDHVQMVLGHCINGLNLNRQLVLEEVLCSLSTHIAT